MSEKQMKLLRKVHNHQVLPKFVPGPVLKEDKTQDLASIQVGPRTITYPKVQPTPNDKFNKETHKAYNQAKKEI